MIYKKLLDQVIKIHFPEANYDLKGKLEWFPVTDQQKKRYFKKRGKELKIQRRRCKTNEVFWEKEKNGKKVSSPYFFYHHILISEIEKNGIFYCISDFCIGRMGPKADLLSAEFANIDARQATKTGVLSLATLASTF